MAERLQPLSPTGFVRSPSGNFAEDCGRPLVEISPCVSRVGSAAKLIGAGTSHLEPFRSMTGQPPRFTSDAEQMQSISSLSASKGYSTTTSYTSSSQQSGQIGGWNSTGTSSGASTQEKNSGVFVTGPLYVKLGKIWALCDCSIGDKYLVYTARNKKHFNSRKIKVSKLIEVKLLHMLHYFDNYVFEVVAKGVVPPSSSASGLGSPFVSSTANHSFGTQGSAPSTRAGRLGGLPNSSPHSAMRKPKPPKTASPLGQQPAEGVDIVTFKAFTSQTFFEWIEAIEDAVEPELRHPLQQRIDQAPSRDAPMESPVLGRGYTTSA